ncbi:hypothetical protein CJJ07_001316 [Candidozyma auris]|uniref:ubiquitin-protein ligase PSH1 n=1 Tax=Candidozyma auris TaxID=498019 RepID=UPI000D2E813D|nr:hypothetical_protein [[Candida] auris]PSK78875.1 hypothetical protein CJJ07_001316 [[Candida] auris]QEL58907.1 hypothetical protein CJJ09_000963 [[Candida] auris]QEO20853.1 hypothetical_protein [[Candida] auris]GBL48628.1 putative DNA repair protein Rad18 [[Candida] auris]
MSVYYDDARVWANIDVELKDQLILNIVSSLECSICSEVMHVPFLASCGHTFCYNCLNAWFETKINCPTCRAELEQPPVLNIQLKDISKRITDIIIETMEDNHHKESLEAARKSVLDDFEESKKKTSLFGDAFNSALTLVDNSDGVPRCGNCHWEAHGSTCLHCGARFRTPRNDSYYDSEDGDAYNEDREEIELYGEENDAYDSEDSFVDSRGLRDINRDRVSDDDGFLDSENDVHSVRSVAWSVDDNEGSLNADEMNQSVDSLERELDALHDSPDYYYPAYEGLGENLSVETISSDDNSDHGEQGLPRSRRRRIVDSDSDSND